MIECDKCGTEIKDGEDHYFHRENNDPQTDRTWCMSCLEQAQNKYDDGDYRHDLALDDKLTGDD